MLMRDPHCGHRNYYTDDPDGPADEWTAWDFALATATQAIIDGTTEFGLLRWEIEDETAEIQIVHEINREREAIALVENADGYKADPGEWLRPTVGHPYWDPESGEPEPFQTRAEWIDKMIAEQQAEPPVD